MPLNQESPVSTITVVSPLISEPICRTISVRLSSRGGVRWRLSTGVGPNALKFDHGRVALLNLAGQSREEVA